MLEAGQLALLPGKGLHHPNPRDVLLRLRGQLGDPLLGLLERRARAASVAPSDQDDEWHRRKRQGREARLKREHRGRRKQDRQQRLTDEDQAVAEEEPHRLEIDRRTRHQLPCLLPIEERQLEPLELPVEPVTKILLDAQ